MKRFTSSYLAASLSVCIFLAACGKKEPAPAQQPQAQAAVVVEEVATPKEPLAAAEQKPAKEAAPAAAKTPAKQSSAAATPLKDYAACLAEWDGKMHTLQTDFIQTTEYDGLPISTSNGRIYYQQQGNKLRLDTLEDSAVTQTALTDKKRIYIQDEKGKEIAKVNWDEWLQGQPNQALFDFGNYKQLLQKHDVDVKNTTNDQATLRLLPKNTSDEYVLYATVDRDTCFPQVITIEADLMQTKAKLENVKLNNTLPTDIFKGLK